MKLVSKVNHPNKRSYREGRGGSDIRSEEALNVQGAEVLRPWVLTKQQLGK